MADGGPGNLHYHFQAIYKANNGSGTDNQPYLQDAYIRFDAWGLHFKLGQFVPPFGYERFQPDYRLDLVDRSSVTGRMAVNGDIGKSFARDRGIEMDKDMGGWAISLGLFQGGGANMDFKGNGPMSVARVIYGRSGIGSCGGHWKTGFAVAYRHADDLDLSKAFPFGGGPLWTHFRGEDRRLNSFLAGGIGPFRAQVEFFQIWLKPDTSRERAPQGAYLQAAWQPSASIILAGRYEYFEPDTHDTRLPNHDLWTIGAVYDFRSYPLRISCDFSHPTTHWSGSHGDTLRLQFQWMLPKWGFHVTGA